MREQRAEITGIVRTFETSDQEYVCGVIEVHGDGIVKFEILGSLTPDVYECARQAFADGETITASGRLDTKGTDRPMEPAPGVGGRYEREPHIEIDRIA